MGGLETGSGGWAEQVGGRYRTSGGCSETCSSVLGARASSGRHHHTGTSRGTGMGTGPDFS